ncbi:BlaI/MecI/CopY family transcriptional regulator [Streptomyces sp. NPDC051563]|uniref:BlaI/MecI/CopY family transcriptional regulator n=1 Tax=Streptomyces sp. NPDC051563 TaxID=3365659 RepID=UPI0037BBF9B1
MPGALRRRIPPSSRQPPRRHRSGPGRNPLTRRVLGWDGREARRPHGELVADVLAILWQAAEPLTPLQINAALGRDLARTTVTTILYRLHEKGTLVRSRAGRGFAYAAADDAWGWRPVACGGSRSGSRSATWC